jgi:uncharacterized protein (TIGR03083 family)
MSTADLRYPKTFEPVPGIAARFTALLRSLRDDEFAAAVPGMAWTVGEVAAHVLNLLERYGGNGRRSATREELTTQNEEEVRATERSRDEIADGIDGAVAVIAELAPGIPLDRRFAFHLGLEVDAAAGWANLCSEFLVHGADIASATGHTWEFPDTYVEGTWRNLMPVAAAWLRPHALKVDEVYEFRFSFGPVLLWLHGGTVTVDDATRSPDHVIEVNDAVTFTLAVPWRRSLVTDPAAALLLSRFYDI